MEKQQRGSLSALSSVGFLKRALVLSSENEISDTIVNKLNILSGTGHCQMSPSGPCGGGQALECLARHQNLCRAGPDHVQDWPHRSPVLNTSWYHFCNIYMNLARGGASWIELVSSACQALILD